MTKRILNKIELSAIAAVDRPCQEGAVVAIMKRAQDTPEAPEFRKLVDDIVKHSDVIDDLRRHPKLGPLSHVLKHSLVSIVMDPFLDPAVKKEMVRNSVSQFVNEIAQKSEVIPELQTLVKVKRLQDITLKAKNALAKLAI